MIDSLLIQTRHLFIEEALLCISYFGQKQWFEVKNVLMMDLIQLLSSQDVNWWTGVVWIIVMFLSAVWTLILTAPIQCRASIAPNVPMKIQTGLRMSTFAANSHFCVNYSFKICSLKMHIWSQALSLLSYTGFEATWSCCMQLQSSGCNDSRCISGCFVLLVWKLEIQS